jgi:MSHA biogenesis protein MshP
MPFKQRSQLGFLLPAAIFLLVILAGLGAYAVNINSVQQQSGVQDIQSTRVYHTARGVMEFGIYQILSGTSLQACPSITNVTINNLDGLKSALINLSCTSQDFTEQGGDNTIRVYSLISKVSSGTINSTDYIERQIDLTISRCIDTSGNICL